MNYGSGTGRTLGLGAVVAIAVTSGPMADSAGATSPPPQPPPTVVEIEVDGLDPEAIVVTADQPTTMEYRFAIDLQPGVYMEQVPAEGEHGGGVVMLFSAGGEFIGAFDDPVLMDADGRLLPTAYRVEGSTLIQTVDISLTTSFPVVVDPIFSSAQWTSGVVMAPTDGTSAFAAASTYIPVPSHYVYNPSLGAVHDYCTSSPDEYPSPVGGNANFRGPCARHDLCYGSPGSDHLWCDNQLYNHMMINCSYAYQHILDPNRNGCYNTAAIYWAAVVAA